MLNTDTCILIMTDLIRNIVIFVVINLYTYKSCTETRNLRAPRVLFFSISTVDFLQFNNYLNINSLLNLYVGSLWTMIQACLHSLRK